MIKLSKFCILLLYRLLLARMYFKSCLWVWHSCAASGANRGRNRDSEVKSRIHLPSLRCPALRWLLRTGPSGSIYSHWAGKEAPARADSPGAHWVPGDPLIPAQGRGVAAPGDGQQGPRWPCSYTRTSYNHMGDCRNKLSAAPCQSVVSKVHTLPLPTCLQLKPALILNPHFLAWIWEGQEGKCASMYLLGLCSPLRLY